MLAAHRNQRSEGSGGALKGTLQRVSDAGRGGQGGALVVGEEDTQPGDGEERGTSRLWMACTFLPVLAQSPRLQGRSGRGSSRNHTPPPPPPRRAPGWGGSTAAFVVPLEFGAATTWLRLLLGDVAATPLLFWGCGKKILSRPPFHLEVLDSTDAVLSLSPSWAFCSFTVYDII
jgi:hypothetical protein